MSSDFIEKQKKLYKSLKSCYCPTLQENVYFKSNGLNHLLYYRRRPRKYSERYYRANLIKYIKEVVENSTQAVRYLKSKKPLIITWNLQCDILDENSKREVIKVILIKKGKGKIYFLSVMRKNNKTKKSKTKRF